MTVLGLAWRGVKHRRLSSILTGLSVALGVALVVLVVTARESARTSFTRVAQGYDLVLGPTHGSALQVTLNTLFHIGDATGTIPWEVYEKVQADERVSYAVPYAVGDNFRGHHVVGTTTDLFVALKDPKGVKLGDEVRGRLFEADTFEAVVGNQVAAKHGMRLGYEFSVSHGVGAAGGVEHAERWTVVGILRPTGTPADRAIYIPIGTFYEIEDHAASADRIRERRGEEGADEDVANGGGPPAEDEGHSHHHGHSHGDGDDQHVHGLSAVGVRCYTPVHRFEIRKEFMEDREDAQAVIPVDQVGELLRIIEQVDKIFEGVAWLVVFIAAMSILVGLYNTIAGRRREIAILRAMGARPGHVFSVIVLESLLICVLGGIAGLLLGYLGLAAAAPTLLERYGVTIDLGDGTLQLQVLGALLIVGVVAGLLPAWRGLRTPVAGNLHPTD